MSAEHRLATAAKITQEVLTGIVDEALPLAECSEVTHHSLDIQGRREKETLKGGLRC
jgi:hypothetical protein